MKRDNETAVEVEIAQVRQGEVNFALIGTTPYVCHSMAQKAKRSLLLPSGRKSDADKAANLKHNPTEEYRESILRSLGDKGETRIMMPASAVKKCAMTAALDLPGAKKAEIGRLLQIKGYTLPLWGVPQLYMAVVRSADIRKTPDIRTRAILPQWATIVSASFVRGKLNEQGIFNLYASAGLTCGLGDGRQEKGTMSFGGFKIVNLDDPEFLEIRAAGGREAQDAALAELTYYDADSQELLEWYAEEIIRREGRKVVKPTKKSAINEPKGEA